MKKSTTVSTVFDCNVILQAAARKKRASAKCFDLIEAGSIKHYLSKDIFAEIEDVLSRPEIRKFFPSLNDEIVKEFLLRLRYKSQLIRKIPKKFTYPRDPDDEPYINLAVEAKADYLVSRDKDLLDLMIGHTPEAKDFRQRFRPLSVIEPLDFLTEINLLDKRP